VALSAATGSLPVHCVLVMYSNVRGRPAFSVMTAGWFCEKSGLIGKVEDVKPVLLKTNGFQPTTILRRRIFTRMNYEIGGFHPV
jgi:hypothetical protein